MNEEIRLPEPKPRDSEPMMIVMELAKIFGDETRKTMEEMGVPGSYKSILFELQRSNGISQLELAKHLRLKPPTISLTIKKMEDDGYVYRKVGVNDMRVFNVYLTEKGTDFLVKNRKRIDNLDEVILEGISEEEKNTILDLLLKMRNNICKATGRSLHPCKNDICSHGKELN